MGNFIWVSAKLGSKMRLAQLLKVPMVSQIVKTVQFIKFWNQVGIKNHFRNLFSINITSL